MARNSLKNICRLLDEVKEEQPIEKSFVLDLKRSIEMSAEKETRKPSQTYKPSSMNCIRNMYYQKTGVDMDNASANACLIGICETGTDRHERVQSAVSNMVNNGIDCEYIDVAEYVKSRELNYLEIVGQSGYETKLFYKDLSLSFLCDGIIKYKGKYYILEIKTESTGKWMSRKDVNPDHIMQGTAYALSFKLDNVLFLYINRDTLDMKAFMLNVTDEMRENLVVKIELCDQHIRDFTVPPKPEPINKKACMYCNYKTRCRKDG